MTTSEQPFILVVDDDAAVCWALEQALVSAGHQALAVADAAAARRALKRRLPDLIITDVRMPGESGLDLLAWLHAEHPAIPVVVSTAYGTVDTAVAAVTRGAFDYLPKPLDLDRTLAVVARAVGETRLSAAAQPSTLVVESLIGQGPAMQEVYRRIAASAPNDLGVLIHGASGTGKELVARTIHGFSPRSAGPFVVLDCATLGEAGGELELFGSSERVGRLAQAQGGTLLLDNVDELSGGMQAALVQFIDTKRWRALGAVSDTAADVRIIAATRADLEGLAFAGSFRQDLLYRLRVVTIPLPPLAERLEDLPALVRQSLARLAHRLGRGLAITDAASQSLSRHAWPGNIRELHHRLAEAAALAAGGVIDCEHVALGPLPVQAGSLAAVLRAEAERLLSSHPGQAHQLLSDTTDAVLLRAALARTQGNQLRAAELLGINRTTLKKRGEALGIVF